MPSNGWSRIGAIVVLTLISIYAVKLSGLALETHQASLAAAGMQAEVAQLKGEVLALETAAVEAESELYVERWAREKRNMVREGDQVLVPVAAPRAAPAAPPPQAETVERSSWQRFVDWLRGESPPGPGVDGAPASP